MNQRKARPRASLFTLESLEYRRHLSVSRDSSGWTVVDPSADTRIIYISSSLGNDSNSGTSADSPLKTIAAGKALLRNGMPDWLLLKRGDVFDQGEGLGGWGFSGRSTNEPMLISSYGPAAARPMLKAGIYNGIYASKPDSPANHVAIIGLDFYANKADPNSPDYDGIAHDNVGLSWYNGSDLLIEDSRFRFFYTNIILSPYSGAVNNITLRRNIVADSYSTDSHSQGAFISGVNGITLEGNVFDHNGWNASIATAEPTIFNHNVYMVANNTGVVVRGNIFANASSHGLQARSGGDIIGNVFLNNPINLLYGRPVLPVTVPAGTISGNYFSGSRDINGMARGSGIDLASPQGGTSITNNIFSGANTQGTAFAIQFSGGWNTGGSDLGFNNMIVANNLIYKWNNGFYFPPGLLPGGITQNSINGLVVKDNSFQQIPGHLVDHPNPYNSIYEPWSGNDYNGTGDPASWFSMGSSYTTTSWSIWHATVDPTGTATKATYADPDRTMATYNASLGGTASVNAFLAQARLQSKTNWRPDYTTDAAISYIKAGFFRAGDLNMDGSVTIADFITLAAHFGQSDQNWTTGDLNGDGTVTVSDMIDLASNWGAVSRAAPNQIAMFAAAISLDANASTSPQDDPDQSSIISDSVDLASNWDILSMPESNNLGEEILASKLLTASTPKVIIRPVWFTYPRR